MKRNAPPHDTDTEVADRLAARAEAEAAELPAPTITTTRYEISCVPEGENALSFTIVVALRDVDLWVVTLPGRCLAKDGTWSWQTRPPEDREEEWRAAHLFDRDSALQAAERAAKLITVRGRTVTDALRDEDTA